MISGRRKKRENLSLEGLQAACRLGGRRDTYQCNPHERVGARQPCGDTVGENDGGAWQFVAQGKIRRAQHSCQRICEGFGAPDVRNCRADRRQIIQSFDVIGGLHTKIAKLFRWASDRCFRKMHSKHKIREIEQISAGFEEIKRSDYCKIMPCANLKLFLQEALLVNQ